MTVDVTNNMNASEDFLELMVSSHVIAAAVKLLGCSSVEEFHTKVTSEGLNQQLNAIALWMCDTFVDLKFIHDASSTPKHSDFDHILEYAKETLSLGLLFLEFKDAVKEGDGTRVLRCWKYFLLLFHASGHSNYGLEALYFLTQYNFVLPPRLAEQMIWGRFVNYEGKKGHNVSADLHMEHMNRLCKDSVSHLGANKTPQAIVKVGKALGGLKAILNHYDKLMGINTCSSHTRRSDNEDLKKVVAELIENKVFVADPGRKHDSFPKLICNQLLMSTNQEHLKAWMKEKIESYLTTSVNSR